MCERHGVNAVAVTRRSCPRALAGQRSCSAPETRRDLKVGGPQREVCRHNSRHGSRREPRGREDDATQPPADDAGDRDIAVLVNDMGTVNVDAELIAEGSELDVDDGVAELSNGCICCELQDDLETAVVRLADDRDFDALVVESSGISEPAPVARLFTTESRVAALYRVDTLVTVLDTRLFLDSFAGETPERRGAAKRVPMETATTRSRRSRPPAFGPHGRTGRTLEPRRADKTDLCTDEEMDEAEDGAGAPARRRDHPNDLPQVDPDRLFDRALFDQTDISDLPGWKRALAESGHGHGEGVATTAATATNPMPTKATRPRTRRPPPSRGGVRGTPSPTAAAGRSTPTGSPRYCRTCRRASSVRRGPSGWRAASDGSSSARPVLDTGGRTGTMDCESPRSRAGYVPLERDRADWHDEHGVAGRSSSRRCRRTTKAPTSRT